MPYSVFCLYGQSSFRVESILVRRSCILDREISVRPVRRLHEPSSLQPVGDADISGRAAISCLFAGVREVEQQSSTSNRDVKQPAVSPRTALQATKEIR
jgi:hypothetical protein